MFRDREKRFGASLLLLAAWWMLNCPAWGQDSRKVPISFLPPPLETATYSLGIYDSKSGKLVRRLQEAATTSAFTVGDNGLITSWDGKDDAGKAAPLGKYAARGYAVGALKVVGVGILGNDWTDDDEDLRVKHIEAITLIPTDNGLAVLATLADGTVELVRYSGDGKLLWRKPVNGLSPGDLPWLNTTADTVSVIPRTPASDGVEVSSVASFHAADGSTSDHTFGVTTKAVPLPKDTLAGTPHRVESPLDESPTVLEDPNLSLQTGVRGSPSTRREGGALRAVSNRWVQCSDGRDGTTWTAAGLLGLVQTAKDGTVLRKLEPKPGEPLPTAVSASRTEDRVYLLEEKGGWQRVRGLSWVETKEEDGKPVSTWQTFFEHHIRPNDPALGLDNPAAPVELPLVDNPLTSGKAKAKLIATFDEKGSYLTTTEGLRLRRISQRANLNEVRLMKDKAPGGLALYQFDGAAWDEFSIEGARNMMEFDAGEFEMTADGEKLHPEKAAEPPDL